jgi:hypothetical protein
MNGDRVNTAHSAAARRAAASRKRHRAELTAFEAWQRRQGAHHDSLPVRRTRRS